ncbi:M24 family metallopeptidase [Halostella salina]|uniref:M24 family metallopeptidase n=1 Tax=Halostella salina TaxID=1547897 RepID=UPI000EF784ED|nr:M24 family metallopeptidase [Halostella salina]
MAPLDTAVLTAAVDERDAAAFLHAGIAAEPTLRYCTGTLPDCEAAYVYADGEATVFLPTAVANSPAFDAMVTDATVRTTDGPVAERAVAALRDRGVSGTVLTPRHVPHDAALYAERAGYEVASTDAVERARAVKTPAERDRIATAGAAAEAGVERARELLGVARVVDGRLRYDGEPVTPRRLRGVVDDAIRAGGASPANATRISVAGDRRTADDPVEAGRTVVVRVAPREPSGYRAALTRTVVVEGEGGWERRAQLAVERALDSALRELEAGVPASTVREEVMIECGAYGFADDALPASAGHGVGLAARERPDLTTDASLSAGTVLAITPSVTDPSGGEVALSDLVAVTEDGYEPLATAERSLEP